MSNIMYKPYSRTSLVVYADKYKYFQPMQQIGGIWYSNLQDGPGWIVPLEREPELKALIEKTKLATLNQIQSNVRSKQAQKKYHRASSDTEDNADSDSEVINMPINVKGRRNAITSIKKQVEERKRSPIEDPIAFYKSFSERKRSKSPVIRERSRSPSYSITPSSSEDEDASDYSSSSADLPSPETPRRRRPYEQKITKPVIDYIHLTEQIKSLNERISELESTKKKKKI